MKTILFIIFILLISLKVSAEPNKLFIDLMNTKVDRLTYGIKKCSDYDIVKDNLMTDILW